MRCDFVCDVISKLGKNASTFGWIVAGLKRSHPFVTMDPYPPHHQQQQVVIVNQPGGAGGGTMPKHGTREWSTGLCGCCEDCGSCK